VFNNGEWVLEFDKDEYCGAQNPGYGPVAGVVGDANLKLGPSINWADDVCNGPIKRKNLVKVPAPGDRVRLEVDGKDVDVEVIEYKKDGGVKVTLHPEPESAETAPEPTTTTGTTPDATAGEEDATAAPTATVCTHHSTHCMYPLVYLNPLVYLKPIVEAQWWLEVSADSPPLWETVLEHARLNKTNSQKVQQDGESAEGAAGAAAEATHGVATAEANNSTTEAEGTSEDGESAEGAAGAAAEATHGETAQESAEASPETNIDKSAEQWSICYGQALTKDESCRLSKAVEDHDIDLDEYPPGYYRFLQRVCEVYKEDHNAKDVLHSRR